MDVVDGRGKHKKILSEENRNTIKHYFKWSPDSTISDCCNATGLSYPTVKKHILAIQWEESMNG